MELPRDERAAFLEEVTSEDAPLGRRLQRMVTTVGPAGAADGEPAEAESLFESMAGRRVGAYRIVRSLGSGGMGEVFLAERADGELRARVALKVARPGGGEEVLRRFRAERQTLANLEHPNIARLLDAGTTEEGRPYFVMEHVDGVRIDEYCDDREAGIEERLRLFLEVCEAVQHAHRNLVVHRDLKPANILVTEAGRVKLLDFGIAKLLPGADSEEMAVETQTGHAAMSLRYASPEQLLGEPITTATDVYALGLLLYLLLTGRHPYVVPADSLAAVWRTIGEEPPTPPSESVAEPYAGMPADRLRRRLAGDLDNIVLEALRKEPARRYPSVDRLAEDIQRHLEGRPVRARPDTLGYRASKFLRRHKIGVAGAVAVTLSALAGISATLWQARIAERHAVDVRSLAGALIFEVDDLIRDLPGSTPARQRIVTRALEYLDRLALEAGEDPELRRELALAYVRVGNIQGNPNQPNLGDTGGALESYRKALVLAERVVAAEPADTETVRSLAIVHEKLSDVRAWTGELPAAAEQAELALALFRNLADRHPGDLRHELSLAISLVKLGDLRGNPSFPNLGKPESALATYREAADLLEDLADSHPEDAGVRRYRGLVQERLGTVLLATGDLDGADTAFRHSLEIRREHADRHPGNMEAERDVAVALEKIADVKMESGTAGEALDELRRSFEIFRSLAEADPENVSARRSLAISHQKLADALEGAGRPEEAAEELRASREILEELVSADSGNRKLEEELAAVSARLSGSG